MSDGAGSGGVTNLGPDGSQSWVQVGNRADCNRWLGTTGFQVSIQAHVIDQ